MVQGQIKIISYNKYKMEALFLQVKNREDLKENLSRELIMIRIMTKYLIT